MAVRVGFDMDGVLADFESAFRGIEHQLFGVSSAVAAESPEVEARQEEEGSGSPSAAAETPKETRRRRDAIWKVIHDTDDFWTTLKPLDPGAVARIHELTLRHGWEVFFITQRPRTTGQTVQRQTQKWLQAQGFDLPSVLVIGGSRGAAARAVRLDYHVDDSPQNCLDVAAESSARAILIVPDTDQITENSAKRLRIAVSRSIGEALDLLDQSMAGDAAGPGMLTKLSRMVGWK
jgi:FMN phosphatase YigB (HAD superfamily)